MFLQEPIEKHSELGDRVQRRRDCNTESSKGFVGNFWSC